MTSSPNAYDADVIVVGAGPSGTFLANLLGQMGLTCLLLEKRRELSPSSMAIGIMPLQELEDPPLFPLVKQVFYTICVIFGLNFWGKFYTDEWASYVGLIPGLLLVFWISVGGLIPDSTDTRLIRYMKYTAFVLLVVFGLNHMFKWYVPMEWVKNLGEFSSMTLVFSMFNIPLFYLFGWLNLKTIKKVRDMQALR